MSYSLRIVNAKQESNILEGSFFLDVEVEIMSGKDVIETRKFAYALDTEKEKIESDLNKFLVTYIRDREEAEADEIRLQQQRQVEETINNLKGVEIEHEQPTAKSKRASSSKRKVSSAR